MLELKQIIKDYKAGDTTVRALDGISLQFREHEFVSILGPSGCGKTTLLNIIGGLDQYTSGDLVINGVSTKQYKAADWDTYRNHSIGFVFQSYNLIPHQTVLANVELALTLSGISKKERRARAARALEDVGLGDQLHKRPNQLSGGQMQRVAIARALVNDPDILLADEPTGALDTQTSVQIMDILQKIAHKKLIIMVTHNPDLAEKYSSRIISVLDGQVVGDTNPYDGKNEPVTDPIAQASYEKPEDIPPKKVKKKKKKSMSFFTALSLSLNNLMTKKGRTFMTSFAGSIGIIGIALILSVSTGVNNYITTVQRDTLASYPIELHTETMDIMAMMNAMAEQSEDQKVDHDLNKIYKSNVLIELVNTMTEAGNKKNDLVSFKEHLESNDKFDEHLTAVQYEYDFNWNILVEQKNDPSNTDPDVIVSDLFGWASGLKQGSSQLASALEMFNGSMSAWTELLAPLDQNSGALVNDVLKEQYELVDEGSRWPTAYNEVVLVVDEHNEISDLTLYALGLRTGAELAEMLMAAQNGEQISTELYAWTFDEIRDTEFRLIPAAENYAQRDDGTYYKLTDTDSGRKLLYDDTEKGFTLKIVGIVRPIEGATASTLTGGSIGYTSALADMVLERTKSNALIQEQKDNPNMDILTGKPFSEGNSTYEGNLFLLGDVKEENPTSIYLFAKTFDDKDAIASLIQDYNDKCEKNGEPDKVIEYTDMVGILMSSITLIVNAITYVLIAFVAISLIVSSIMIGIITYISVLERTKEIGILRAIGASKRDISRVFNAETLTVGFVAGVIGIGLTLIFNIIINIILFNLTGIPNLKASLPILGAVILVAISMLLTFIAGLVPSRFAAKKNPVEALRSE
ncbi:MAG: ABC transporter ATP-binding protein/permease [Clostridia bacterium]|nr:ABC transporter ATP-binding protein/permease [Clostridia bacterium]